MHPQTMISRSDRAVFRDLVDGTGVLLNLDTAGYHGVNRLGALIWRMLASETSFAELVRRLRVELPNAPRELEQDVAEYLAALGDRDLIFLYTVGT